MSDPVDLLANTEALTNADRGALLPAVATAGAQVRATPSMLAEHLARFTGQRPRSLVIVAQGRAAQDAQVAVALLGSRCPVPVQVCQQLPGWVGALDAVVVLAADPDTGGFGMAEGVEVARRRGAMLLVRAAPRGELPYFAAEALYPPVVGAPEALAGPSRLALLLYVASACGLLPQPLSEADAGDVAELLDAESLSCAPKVDSFANPAKALALHLLAGVGVLVASDPVSAALVGHGGSVLAELGGYAAAGYGPEQLGQSPALVTRLQHRPDLFADPFDQLLTGDDDQAADQPMLRPLLLRAQDGVSDSQPDLAQSTELSDQMLSVRYASMAAALPSALVLDGPELVRARSETALPLARSQPPGTAGSLRPGVQDWAAAALLMLRLDFAAVYCGISAGQTVPLDAPAGLGPPGGGRHLVRPDTVDQIHREQTDDDQTYHDQTYPNGEDIDRWN